MTIHNELNLILHKFFDKTYEVIGSEIHFLLKPESQTHFDFKVKFLIKKNQRKKIVNWRLYSKNINIMNYENELNIINRLVIDAFETLINSENANPNKPVFLK